MEKMCTGNVLFCGVGGQGILLASEITSYALIEGGFDIKKSEVHGMAQRGGSVEAHLKYGEKVYSPLIEQGGADIIVAFELLEALRYLPYAHPGSKVIVNTQKILPPSVALGKEEYPADALAELRSRGLTVYDVDAFAIAREVGELRAVNMALVGAFSNFLPLDENVFLDVITIRVKKGFEEVNTAAFRKGRALTSE
ncbi:indolepyruvate oxidoreductase subunit beta [Nitrospirota bacterium]